MRRQSILTRHLTSAALVAVLAAELGGCQTMSDVTGSIASRSDPAPDDPRRNLEVYGERGFGPARKAIALPMIATPEFMRAVAAHCPELIVYTGRLDRGLSPPEVLRRPPGTVPGERGLTDNQYIVPGAGGIGEVLTNSWV